MNWTIKTKISTQKDKYTKKYAFWVNNFNIVNYYTGTDYFASQLDNYRSNKMRCRKTIWNSNELSKLLQTNITVGSTYKNGNSVFQDDTPTNQYTGTAFNKTKLIEIMNDYKPINERKYVKTFEAFPFVKNFFKNKTIHPFSMSHDTIPTDKLSVDDFNKWFNEEYRYDGYKGSAKGIFLRIDKLSIGMIDEYFKSINVSSDEYAFQEIIRNDWKNKR